VQEERLADGFSPQKEKKFFNLPKRKDSFIKLVDPMGSGNSKNYHPAAQNRVFKYQRDVHNHEHLYWFFDTKVKALPEKVDLSDGFAPVYDQGHLGSCTANASTALLQYEAKKMGYPNQENFSRLFEYYQSRANQIPPDTNTDTGASLAVSILCLSKFGVCLEADWPYDISKFTVAPTKDLCDKALMYKCGAGKRVTPTHEQLRGGLSEGFPFVLGINVYESFMTVNVGNTGIIPIPLLTDTTIDGKTVKADTLLGGHAIVCVGYDDSTRLYKFRNSWSEKWGDKGYGYLPYDYVENHNLAFDMWAIKDIVFTVPKETVPSTPAITDVSATVTSVDASTSITVAAADVSTSVVSADASTSVVSAEAAAEATQ
jgi:C1A family cysteine protease